MENKCSLLLEDVLSSIKDKSLERKYGHIQASYQDLYNEWQTLRTRLKTLEKWGREMAKLLKPIENAISRSPNYSEDWYDLHEKIYAKYNQARTLELVEE